MQKDMSTQLVTDAMTMALWRRRPDTAALMHHSDQGTNMRASCIKSSSKITASNAA